MLYGPDRPFLQLESFEVRQVAFLNYINFADLLILKLQNCERVSRVARKRHNALRITRIWNKESSNSLSISMFTLHRVVWPRSGEVIE